MKIGTIPFPREFGVGAKGPDCKAVKRAVAKANGGPHGMSLKTPVFARTAGVQLATFQHAAHLTVDGVYGQLTHDALQPYFDSYGASLMNEEYAALAGTRQRTVYVRTWFWMIGHPALFDYGQVRPIPEDVQPFETIHVIVTDCSGATEIAAKWSDLPDPSKLNYDGQGNTGTLLAAGREVTQAQALPGDLIIYRDGRSDTYGHHVVSILKCHPGNADFDCGSFGSNPIHEITHSAELAYQAAHGHGLATFVRWLPA